MAALRKTDDRAFWVALAGAVVLHAALIIGAIRSPPRQMGEREGVADAVSVDLVDPDGFMNRPVEPEHEAAPQGASNSDAQPKRPAPDADARTEAVRDKPKIDAPALPDDTQGALPRPNPEPKKNTATNTTPSKPKASPQQQLDLSLPSKSLSGQSLFAGGQSSAMTRPPGITRSGENDDFGRDVIKALRKTMPPPDRTVGRVTVRFLLSENGDVVDLQLIRSSGNSRLDQSVLFAVRQSIFPFPPKGSTRDDRMFLITYIYE